MGTTQVILSTFGDHLMKRHETMRGFAISPVPDYASHRGLTDFVWNGEAVFHMPAPATDGPSAYEIAVARQAVTLAAYDMALDMATKPSWPIEQFDARWIAKASDYCRPMVPTSLIVAQLPELRKDYEDMLALLQALPSYRDMLAVTKECKAEVALHGFQPGSTVDRMEQYREALLARLPMIQTWAKVLSQSVALCVEETHAGLQQLTVLADVLRTHTSLTVVVDGEANEDEGEDATPVVSAPICRETEDEMRAAAPWRPTLPQPTVSSPAAARQAYDLSTATVTVYDAQSYGTEFGEVQAVAEASPLWLDIEENGLQPGLQLLDLPEPEPMPTLALSEDEQATVQTALDARGLSLGSITTPALLALLREALPSHQEALDTFEERYQGWMEREQQKAQRLSLDLIQERLNAPGRRILDRRAAARRHPAARVLVTRALRTPQQPHQELILAGLLLPSNDVQGTDDPVAVADWLHQVAIDPELFHEFTKDPDAPAHLANVGLTTEGVFSTGDLARLSDDLQLAILKEAGGAIGLLQGPNPRLEAAIAKIAHDRGLDIQLLRGYVREVLQRNDRLYSAIGIAFVCGQSQGTHWQTKMRMDGRRGWIRPWIQAVAAVAYHVQHAAHWKARALAFGALTPAEASGIWTRLSAFEREFIRIRVHSIFTYTSAALGANRLVPTMPLGLAVQRARDLAAARRTASPVSAMTSHSPVMR